LPLALEIIHNYIFISYFYPLLYDIALYIQLTHNIKTKCFYALIFSLIDPIYDRDRRNGNHYGSCKNIAIYKAVGLLSQVVGQEKETARGKAKKTLQRHQCYSLVNLPYPGTGHAIFY
jgi:hypothetical protein